MSEKSNNQSKMSTQFDQMIRSLLESIADQDANVRETVASSLTTIGLSLSFVLFSWLRAHKM